MYVKYAMAKSIDEPWVTPDSTGHACSRTRPLRHRTPQYRKHSGNR